MKFKIITLGVFLVIALTGSIRAKTIISPIMYGNIHVFIPTADNAWHTVDGRQIMLTNHTPNQICIQKFLNITSLSPVTYTSSMSYLVIIDPSSHEKFTKGEIMSCWSRLNKCSQSHIVPLNVYIVHVLQSKLKLFLNKGCHCHRSQKYLPHQKLMYNFCMFYIYICKIQTTVNFIFTSSSH